MVGRFDLSRRSLVAGLTAAPILAAGVRTATAQTEATNSMTQGLQSALKNAKGTSLVMLGTAGGPAPKPTRYMTSHVMPSDGAAYVLDCGLGVTSQFARTGIPFGAVRSIFIIHHHPDHNIEYGPLLIIGWTQGLRLDVRAFGPPPAAQADDGRPAPSVPDDDRLLGRGPQGEAARDGRGRRDSGGRTGHAGRHRQGFRDRRRAPAGEAVDFKDRSIAFSGDTVPLDAVAKMAKGADVLVHEAMYLPALEPVIERQLAKGQPGTLADFMAHMKADHTPAEDAGRIAQEAGVRTRVLSHLMLAIPSVSDETWRAAAAKHFKGEIIVAQDLMVI